jgi:hypothetical protein
LRAVKKINVGYRLRIKFANLFLLFLSHFEQGKSWGGSGLPDGNKTSDFINMACQQIGNAVIPKVVRAVF